MAKIAVAPLVGAWIEIHLFSDVSRMILSLPSWERGLKYVKPQFPQCYSFVAPLVGAWIEIFLSDFVATPATVAPLVGAWIEIP